MLNHLDLFSGIGGFALAAEMVGGIKTVGFSEVDPFCNAVLRKQWPTVPNLGDVRNITNGLLQEKKINQIDLITGGFPCQPWSQASKNPKGTNDERHLWPEMLRVISEVRPTWICGENVYGIISKYLDTLVYDLEGAGYEVWPAVVPACSVGSPHRRYRIWLMAHRNSPTEQRISRLRDGNWPTLWDNIDGCGETLGHSYDSGSQGHWEHGECTGEWLPSASGSPVGDSSGVKEPEQVNEANPRSVERQGRISVSTGGTDYERDFESRLGGATDGLSSWVDQFKWPAGKGAKQYAWEKPRVAPTHLIEDRQNRLSALGNSVVPQVAAIFLRSIVEAGI